MESEVTHSPDFYRLWAWFEKNQKQVKMGASVALVLGVIIWFFVWRQGEKAAESGSALSNVFVPQVVMNSGQRSESPEAFLKVAADYAGSKAAEQALLLAAGSLFAEGKYSEAQTQFERFKRDYRNSPLIGSVLLGIAACYEAQGKSSDATTAYKDLVDHHSGEPVVPQAKFALGRLYEAQGKPELALVQYEDVVRSDPYGNSIGNEAAMRAAELKIKFPNLVPKPPAVTTTNAPPVNPTVPAPTPAPAAAAPKASAPAAAPAPASKPAPSTAPQPKR